MPKVVVSELVVVVEYVDVTCELSSYFHLSSGMISLRPELSNNFTILSPISSTIRLHLHSIQPCIREHSPQRSSMVCPAAPPPLHTWLNKLPHTLLLLNRYINTVALDPTKTLPLLPSLEGADSPFLRTTSTAVLRATATNS